MAKRDSRKKSKSGMYFLVSAIIVLIIVGVAYYYFGNAKPAPVMEDKWVKDSKGVWVQQGNPAVTPDNVLAQQDAITCGEKLYNAQKPSGAMKFTSECLGKCGDYSIDVVNVPRTAQDDLQHFQCLEYLNGITKNLIEVDADGNIVRVLD